MRNFADWLILSMRKEGALQHILLGWNQPKADTVCSPPQPACRGLVTFKLERILGESAGSLRSESSSRAVVREE